MGVRSCGDSHHSGVPQQVARGGDVCRGLGRHEAAFAKLASMSGILALRRSYGGRVSGRHDRDDAKRNEIRPARHPLIKQRPVIALHHLIAPCQILCDPARHIAKAVGLLAPGLAEAAVDWSSITVTKIFDDHVEHRQVSRMLWEQNFAISMAAWQVVVWQSGAAEATHINLVCPSRSRAEGMWVVRGGRLASTA